MNPIPPVSRIPLLRAALLTATAVLHPAFATDLTWDTAPGDNAVTGGAGTWDTVTANWTANAGASDQAWVNANQDTAIFGGTGAAVTLGGPVTVGGLTFTAGGYTLSGGTLTFAAGSRLDANSGNATINSALAGSGALTKTGSWIVTLGAAGAQAFTGGLSIDDGALELNNGTSLANGGGITINGASGTVGGPNYPFKGVTRNGTLILHGSNGSPTDQLGAQTVTMNNGTVLWQSDGGADTIVLQNAVSNSGHNVFTVAPTGGNDTLSIGNLTRNGNSTVEFRAAYDALGTGQPRIQVGTLNGVAIANTNGIIGGWATVAHNGAPGEYAGSARQFARWDPTANGGAGSIVAATPDKSTGAAGATLPAQAISTAVATENWLVNSVSTLTANTTVNSLIVENDLLINNGAQLKIDSGGLILRTNNFWIQSNAGTPGTLTSGAAGGGLFVQTDGGSDQAIRVAITDNGATPVQLVKSGLGTLKIDRTNTFTGGTIVDQGTLQIEGGGGSAGGIRGAATVNPGAVLQLNSSDALGYSGSAATAVTSLTVNDATVNLNTTTNQTFSNMVLTLKGGTVTGIAGSQFDLFNGGAGNTSIVTLASTKTSVISTPVMDLRQALSVIDTAAGSTASGVDLQISAVVRDDGGVRTLTKTGAGAMALTAANTYSGGTELLGGTIQVNAMSGIGGGYLAVKNGATFVYNGAGSETTTRLLWLDNGAANLKVTNASATLTWNDSGSTKNGAITKSGAGTLILGGAISGGASVTVNGGTLVLTGANTYSGATTVNQGKLIADGSSTGSITVGVDGALGGSGSIAGAVTVAGTLAPGNSPGTLTLGSDLVLTSTAIAAFEINPLDTTSGGGINDLVDVAGSLTLDGVLNISSLGSFAAVTSGVWTLFNFDGSLTDNGMTLGSVPALDAGYNWSLTTTAPAGGSPGLVSLSIVPEPGVLALASFALLGLARRRRA